MKSLVVIIILVISLLTLTLNQANLAYSLYGDMYAYNSLQHGFNAIAAQFNGFAELLNRDDASKELLVRYKAMKLETKPEEVYHSIRWKP